MQAHFIDPAWARSERQLVAEYLERGTLVNQYRGLSWCRFCRRHNGSAELTDGAFCWPEGLAHYLWEHDVRLPGRIITHVHDSPVRPGDAPRPTFDDRGQRDRTWPGAEFARFLWMPPEPHGDYGLYIEADPTWWLRQTGFAETAQ